jgi:hypothetical protein
MDVFVLVLCYGRPPDHFHDVAVEVNIGLTGVEKDPVAIERDYLQIADCGRKCLPRAVIDVLDRMLAVRACLLFRFRSKHCLPLTGFRTKNTNKYKGSWEIPIFDIRYPAFDLNMGNPR